MGVGRAKRRGRWGPAVGVGLLALAGCYAGTSAAPGDEDSATDGSASGPGGSDGDSTGDPGEEDHASAPFPAGLRRLTRQQVENAYRDVLLHPDLGLGDRLPLDPSTDEDFRFDTERVALAPFGATDVTKFDTVALSVVDEVFALPSDALLGCSPAAADDACARGYIEGMLGRAFRRPPAADEVEAYVALALDTEDDLGDPIQGLEFATATALQSPWFLYMPEVGEGEGEDRRALSNHELASRLSFFLWNTPPDAELRALADEGVLVEDETLRAQVRRMLQDDRGRDAMQRFFTQWFGYDDIELIAKNSGVFPDYQPALVAGMRVELDGAVQAILGGASFDTLFTSEQTWVTPSLADFYGIELPGPEGEETVLEHFEAEDDGPGCNADAVPAEYHNLCSDTASLRYTFTADEAAAHRIVVRAYATQGGDETTRLRVSIDGESVELDVSATLDAPEAYAVPFALVAGEHEVVLELANDFYAPPENRDVIVDWVEVHSSTLDPDAVFEAALPPERAGLLTRAGILAVYAKPIDTSPTTRGLFVRQRLLCETIPAPPPGVPTELPPPSEDIATNRERVEAHMTDPSCAGCHQFIDPLGLALEHFDGIGKYREDHDGAPLDVTGDLDGMAFDGAVELGKLLASDPRIPRCAVRQLSRFALGIEEEDAQRELLEPIGAALESSGRWPDAVEALVLSELFRTVGPAREED